MIEAYIAGAAAAILWACGLYGITREVVGCFREARERRAHERFLDEQWDDGAEPEWIREARAEIDRLPEVVS